MDERSTGFKLETAQDGSQVPCLNGVYLHSLFKPKNEAKKFIDKYGEKIKKANSALIFGLGFGHHVDEVLERNPNINIVIIEAHQELIDRFFEHRSFPENVNIFCLKEYKSLYQTEAFVNFLISKPVIINHEASFLMAPKEYRNFLSYRAPGLSKDYKELLQDNVFEGLALEENLNLRSNFEKIANKKSNFEKSHMLQFFLKEVLAKSNQENLS